MVCFSFCLSANSQEGEPSFLETPSTNISIGVGYDLPLGDLAERFGGSMAVKGFVERQTRSDWIYGGQYDLIFGNKVKEDVLAHVRLENGRLLGSAQSYADVFLRQRGGYAGLYAGKAFRLSDTYKSYLKVTLGGGMLYHRIRIVDDSRNFTPVQNGYEVGYDRLTRGLALKQFVGWQYLSQNGRVNFYMGLEFMEAFTSNVRTYDFDKARVASNTRRFDGMVGAKIGFIMPIYGQHRDQEIFY